MFRYETGTASGITQFIYKLRRFARLVGWRVESWAGNNIVFSSVGEGENMTMLFIHVWESAPGIISGEVRDDAAGTHETTSLSFCNVGLGNFNYYLSGDKDAIIIITYDPMMTCGAMYLGLVYPFAIEPPDETYYSIAGGPFAVLIGSRVLRDPTAWDQALVFTGGPFQTLADRFDGSVVLSAVYASSAATVVGELKNFAVVDNAVFAVDDTITTGPGVSTDWLVLSDGAVFFALRTGGDEPLGEDLEYSKPVPSSIFRAYSNRELFSVLVPFMTARGWTATDYSGVSGFDRDYVFHSTGETGLDDIYLRAFWDDALDTDYLNVRIQDDVAGTHNRNLADDFTDRRLLPHKFQFYANKDFLVVIHSVDHTSYPGGFPPAYVSVEGIIDPYVIWAGRAMSFAPGLKDGNTPYNMILAATTRTGARYHMRLREHDGTWAAVAEDANIDFGTALAVNPIEADGATFVMYPPYCWATVRDYHSILKHIYNIPNSGGMVNGDVIECGTEEFKVLRFRQPGGGLENLVGIRAL